MKHFNILLFFIFSFALLSARNDITNEFDTIQNLLAADEDYQQLLARYQREIAEAKIHNSLQFFDLNFSFQQYENEMTRDETVDVLEASDIDETDQRWQITLERQFFPKDFDTISDQLSSNINLLRFEQELQMTRLNSLSDSWNDILDWFEAVETQEIIKQKLQVLWQENLILEELIAENLIKVDHLIKNLEDISELEDEQADLKADIAEYETIFHPWLNKYLEYLETSNPDISLVDTLQFRAITDQKIKAFFKQYEKLEKKLNFYYFQAYLPEINLSLSYNWRETDQDWDITKNNVTKNMMRKQTEQYPEAEVEFSIPLNFISNTGGKLTLLESYKTELENRFRELHRQWLNFQTKMLQNYLAAFEMYQRQSRLMELYDQKLINIENKFQQEASLLGDNPELKLQKEKLKHREAEIEFKKAKMQMQIITFLINFFVEENK